jgi:hypothetical protein
MGRHEQLENEHKRAQEGNSGKYNWADVRALERLGIPEYRAEGGDNYIRVITPKFSKYHQDDLPFYWLEVWIHSDVGADGRTFVCPRKMWNEPCAVCDYSETIRAKDPESEVLKVLWPGRRYMFFLYNVKDEATEKLGLHWYDAPVSVKDGIVAISRDKRKGTFIDISTLEEGSDIEFEKTGKRMKTSYSGFKLSNDNGKPPKEWYQNVPDDFDEFILRPDYNKVAVECGLASPRTRGGEEKPAQEESQSRSRSRQPEQPAQEKPAQEKPVEEESQGRSRSRSRGDAEGGGGIDPQVQARIDAIKGKGGDN